MFLAFGKNSSGLIFQYAFVFCEVVTSNKSEFESVSKVLFVCSAQTNTTTTVVTPWIEEDQCSS